MKGLRSSESWRTFLAGFLLGYLAAWGFHWATTFYAWGIPTHHHIPGLTPEPPAVERHGR